MGIGNLLRETGVAFARSCARGSETGVAFAREGSAPTETAISFAGEKWAFWVRFSVAEVMVVSRWSASVVAEVSVVSTSSRHSCLCAKKFALLGPMVGVSAKKFALRAQNGPNSAFYGALGELFRGTVAERTVLGELFRGTVAERSVLGEFFRAYRHGSHVMCPGYCGECLRPDWRFGMSGQRKYSMELRERATRMALEARADPGRRRGAIKRIGGQLGINPEALRTWVRAVEQGGRNERGEVSDQEARIRALEAENRELRRANEILKAASAFFGAELDRLGR